MKWQTEVLDGVLEICNNNDDLIYHRTFKLPAKDVIGQDAEEKILEAAGVFLSPRCVRHFTFCPIINARLTPHEHFVFRRKSLPYVKYMIALAPEGDSASAFSPKADDDFQFTLDALKKSPDKSLTLEDLQSPGQMIDAVGKVTDLHYLTLLYCHNIGNYPIFPAIGSLKSLRGLDINQWNENMIFDLAAVAELRKLKQLEVLALRHGIIFTDEALRELGTFKNLRALCLNLFGHEFADREACVAMLAFLKGFDNLEYLRITSPFAHSRKKHLTPRDLQLPPNLKYLVLDGKELRAQRVPTSQDRKDTQSIFQYL